MLVNQIEDVRAVLQKFQDFYTARDEKNLDAVMSLFLEREDIEMIGIGAQKPNGREWFLGREQIRDIISGDWQYWGDVCFDVKGAKVTVLGEAAWLSTTGKVIQTEAHVEAMKDYLIQMKEMLEQSLDGAGSAEGIMMEAAHFGIRRLREKTLGVGYAWPLVFTAVFVKDGPDWKFHTLHWAMPVD